jgi:signal peptidase I
MSFSNAISLCLPDAYHLPNVQPGIGARETSSGFRKSWSNYISLFLVATVKHNQVEFKLLPKAMPEPDSKVASELLRQSLREGKQPYVTVASNSMLPLLRRGDQIRLAGILVEELQRGDIIVVGAPAELTVHRFWGIQRRDGGLGLLTKGDHHLHFDPLVPATAIIGRVTRRQRNNLTLILTSGIGEWLNHRLADLVSLEVRLLNIRVEPMNAGIDVDNGKRKVHSPSRQIVTRLTHSLLYGIALTFTLLTSAVAQTKVKA